MDISKNIEKAEIIPSYHSSCSGRSLLRRRVSVFYTFLINFVSGHKAHYYNGLPIVRRKYAMQFGGKDPGFVFQADLVTQLLDHGLSLLQVPVVAQKRKGGSSNTLTKRNFLCVSKLLGRIVLRRIHNLFGKPRLVNREV